MINVTLLLLDNAVLAETVLKNVLRLIYQMETHRCLKLFKTSGFISFFQAGSLSYNSSPLLLPFTLLKMSLESWLNVV